MDGVAKAIKEVCGDKPCIISMANCLDNQKILPNYFTKVIYCVISYNAWVGEPGIAGYHTKGAIIFGTPDNSLLEEMKSIQDNFKNVIEIVESEQILDAVHTKIIINLTNALTTLTGHGFSLKLFHQLPLSDGNKTNPVRF